MRPRFGLHRVLRRPDQGRARTGLGDHLPGRTGRSAGGLDRILRARVRRPDGPPRPPLDRSPGAGAGYPAPRRDPRIFPANKVAERASPRISERGVSPESLRGADIAAWNLLFERHSGRNADRPSDQLRVGGLRSRSAGDAGVQRSGSELLHRPPVARRRVPRGRARSIDGVLQHQSALDPVGGLWVGGDRPTGPLRGVVRGLCGQSGLRHPGRRESGHLSRAEGGIRQGARGRSGDSPGAQHASGDSRRLRGR